MNDLIINLEKELMNEEVRSSDKRLNELISDDFIEFGASGKIFNKRNITELLAKDTNILIEGNDFETKELAHNIILITYKGYDRNLVTGVERYSLRSSIWQLSENRWQIIFHQGTLIPEVNKH